MIYNYSEKSFSEIAHLLNEDIVLLVTATNIETEETHKTLQPIWGYDVILKFHEGHLTFYLGRLNKYKVVHVQCSMGSISSEGSTMTVSEALKTLRCKVVIMVGIAFGVDSEEQKIGDVLIAEAVQPYNNKRIGKEKNTQRAYALKSSKVLLNRFKNLRTWEYFPTNGVKSSIIPCLLLSGEELIDNKEYRDKLLLSYPTAKGGEMEGAGVYSACDGKADCILIKGICDFADGEKSQNKDANQHLAVKAALSACLEVFASQTAFIELGIKPLTLKQEYKPVNPALLNEVLFDIYSAKHEPYYIEREDDKSFMKAINQYGSWVYGTTGCGKSNLVTRTLVKNKINFIHISLASCIGLSVESFFIEILFDLSFKIDGIQSVTQPNNFTDCIRLLLSLLEKKFKNKKLLLFIEEIPISDEDNYRDFVQRIYSLIISKSLIPSLLDIRFILSSINSPVAHIQGFNQKVHQHLKFVELKNWLDADINRLSEMIIERLCLNFTYDEKQAIIRSAKGSPRFIKKFFRNFVSNDLNHNDFNIILMETERELNLIENA